MKNAEDIPKGWTWERFTLVNALWTWQKNVEVVVVCEPFVGEKPRMMLLLIPFLMLFDDFDVKMSYKYGTCSILRCKSKFFQAPRQNGPAERAKAPNVRAARTPTTAQPLGVELKLLQQAAAETMFNYASLLWLYL